MKNKTQILGITALLLVCSGFFVYRERIKTSLFPVTPKLLTENKNKWDGQNLDGYEYDLQIRGKLRKDYHVVVENREVVAVTEQGQAVDVRHDVSIPGLFASIEYDVKTSKAKGRSKNRMAKLSVAFSNRWGYPELYLRRASAPFKSGYVTWRIENFEPKLAE